MYPHSYTSNVYTRHIYNVCVHTRAHTQIIMNYWGKKCTNGWTIPVVAIISTRCWGANLDRYENFTDWTKLQSLFLGKFMLRIQTYSALAVQPSRVPSVFPLSVFAAASQHANLQRPCIGSPRDVLLKGTCFFPWPLQERLLCRQCSRCIAHWGDTSPTCSTLMDVGI